MSRQFVEKWVYNERTGSANREIDEIRSGYPPALFASQWYSGVLLYTASNEYTMLLCVPSNKEFILERIIVDNDNAGGAKLGLYNYAADSTVSFLAVRMKIAGSQTEFVNNLHVPFVGGVSGGVYMCAPQTGLWIRVQGVLIASE